MDSTPQIRLSNGFVGNQFPVIRNVEQVPILLEEQLLARVGIKLFSKHNIVAGACPRVRIRCPVTS